MISVQGIHLNLEKGNVEIGQNDKIQQTHQFLAYERSIRIERSGTESMWLLG